MTDGVPDHAPDPATIEQAEEANEPLHRRRPRTSDVTDPTDPVADRDDATGRG